MILPLSYFTKQKKGDLISRMTADVFEIEWSIMSSIQMVFREPFTITIFLITLFSINAKLTVMVLLVMPLTVFFIGLIAKSLKRKSLIAQQKMGDLISTFEESISGLRIIKAFSAIDKMINIFKRINRDYTNITVKIYRRRDLAAPLIEMLGALVLVIVIWFGGSLVLNADESIKAGELILFVVIFARIVPPSQGLATAIYAIQKGIASAERINEVMDADEVIVEKKDAFPIKDFNSEIEYKNVSFVYEKEAVLKNINIKISKGKTIAIVGYSGAGKSTLVDLLSRFYDCTMGEIVIDGVPIKDYIISDIRAIMGIVTQESILFNDTVFNNIAFGLKGVTEGQIMEAAKVANAHKFISEMGNGYYTYIGDMGVKLSGGQRQRISIARAVLRNPPIMILDEATSSLDTESERLVQDALFKLMQNRTSVVIAHRLSTIQFADEIIVLDNGQLVERGNHDELLALKGVYKKLCLLQSFK